MAITKTKFNSCDGLLLRCCLAYNRIRDSEINVLTLELVVESYIAAILAMREVANKRELSKITEYATWLQRFTSDAESVGAENYIPTQADRDAAYEFVAFLRSFAKTNLVYFSDRLIDKALAASKNAIQKSNAKAVSW